MKIARTVSAGVLTQLKKSNVMSPTESIGAWIRLSRPPFHLVGVFPFLLGGILSWRIYNSFKWGVFAWSVSAVILIMLSTYYTGEYHDLKEDRLSADMDRNIFSGGTQVIVKSMLPHKLAGTAGYITIALACLIGIVLQFYYKTGPWTIPLGVMGMLAGFFYSTPPVRWVTRGLGEVMIGFSYGWLPVAVSFYLQSGSIDSIVHWVALPIACTIFNVILINEFPDYPADLIVKKNNLVVRMGKNRAAFLYVSATIVAWITFALSVKQGLPSIALIFYLPVFIVSLILVILMFQKKYLNKMALETICGLTITVNLGTSLCYILAVWHGGF